MRALRLAAGGGLVILGLVLLWGLGIVQPPEGITRRLAAFQAVFPGRWTDAEVERIPCPPLLRLRLYVVCTEGCDGTWKVVGTRGLVVAPIVNLNRLPLEPAEETRRRLNREVAREALRLDAGGAAEMIGCYLRLEGLHPELILTDAALAAVDLARSDPRPEEAMLGIASSLDDPEALSRLHVAETPGGFESSFDYWDTGSAGRPVLRMEYRLRRDGALLDVRTRERQVTGGTASGNTPGIPPT